MSKNIPDPIEVINYLKNIKDLSSLNAVELFARDGSWMTSRFAPLVKSIQAWEINEEYFSGLKKNIPGVIIKHVDSIKYIKECPDKFGFISVDNPMGIYGNGYCEHFEIFESLGRIMQPRTVVLFVVNFYPYDARKAGNDNQSDDYGMADSGLEKWFRRRNKFYKTDAARLSLDYIRNFYTQYFRKKGYACSDFRMFVQKSPIADHPDFICRCIAVLDKSTI